ncbi:TIGR04150 pseudo-rSAM protein [Parabacteroides sp. AM08-6]|uniref:TIGR04150 pseudo-rSAM protein n=1 Tax=Parabacteroides sp. AM08-6 TaxID=2292053 RepID=UPI000F000745|nr:TIGR04150 pseudo-rSAM protein [Parabacteroides sp. AM08-6]RHJ75310.1 TIGR04150 pseudo-rSAM protein [Parabacteroides sp. AM08-6]
MRKYWLMIEPDTFIWKKKNRMLAYNTVNGGMLPLNCSDSWDDKYTTLMNPDNLYCVELTDIDFQDTLFAESINSLTENGFAKLFVQKEGEDRPVSLYPLLSVQRSRAKFLKKPEILEYENFLRYIQEVVIYLNGNEKDANGLFKQQPYFLAGQGTLDYSLLGSFLERVKVSTVGSIKICGKDIFAYEAFRPLLGELDKIHAAKELYVSCSQLIEHANEIKIAGSEQFKWKITVDCWHPFVAQLLPLLADVHVEWVFYVTSLEDCESAENIIETNGLEKYQVKPLFTGDNLSFFEEYIYLTEEDLRTIRLNKRQVFANMALNVDDFGKLTVLPDGEIYANVNMPALGNLQRNDISHLVKDEILYGKSWLRVREQQPCSECLYQWLCQSPSSYELAIGKSNLCHIR